MILPVAFSFTTSKYLSLFLSIRRSFSTQSPVVLRTWSPVKNSTRSRLFPDCDGSFATPDTLAWISHVSLNVRPKHRLLDPHFGQAAGGECNENTSSHSPHATETISALAVFKKEPAPKPILLKPSDAAIGNLCQFCYNQLKLPPSRRERRHAHPQCELDRGA